jgi:FdhD protein
MTEPGLPDASPEEQEIPLDAVALGRYVRFQGDVGRVVEGGVIGEIRLTVLVDGQELVTLMCSPWKLHTLVLGFLYLEGLIEKADDVDLLRVCVEDRLAEVRLRSARPLQPPAHRILTSGCGGGTSFDTYLERIQPFRLDDGPRVPPRHLYGLMRALYERASLYRQVRGCHSSLLADERGPLLLAEDIGRHNTIDKLCGAALLDGIPTRDTVLVSSGRISSEMLLKSAVLGVPIVCSRTSPTALAVRLAQHLNVTVVGYIRNETMNVYSHPWRIGG